MTKSDRFPAIDELSDASIISKVDSIAIGSDTNDPTQTAMIAFKTDVDDYNGEAMSAGDVLIGDNSAGSNNVKIRGSSLALRNGTNNIMTFDSSGVALLLGALSFGGKDVSIGSGTIDLDDGTAGLMNTSFLRISASTGNFSIRGIATPINPRQELFLFNDTTNNMTIVGAGSPAAGYSHINTLDGSSPATTGYGMAHLIHEPTGDHWILVSIRG